MSIHSLSKQEVRDQILQAQSSETENNQVRILFVPNKIDQSNFGELTSTYKTVCGKNFDSVVVIESYTGHLEKKLAMPSNKIFETRFGEVEVNDFLRNEFCDEEDDFFITDEGFNKEMSLFTQLPILQACLDDFDVVSLQIGDYDPAIFRELAHALDELLFNRNVLIVFCCDVPASNPAELDKIRTMVVENRESELQNYLNSSDKQVKGARAFMTGVLVAKAWELEIEFLDHIEGATHICGYAKESQKQLA